MRRIIDKREKKKFFANDEYIDKLARQCGWQASIVYQSLCRHTDKNQECFPSIKLMAEEHNVSCPTINKGIRALKKYNLIKIEKNKRKKGRWANNIYILLDKSVWIKHQVNNIDSVNHVNKDSLPSKPGLSNQVNDIDTKETHNKEPYIRNHNVGSNNNLADKKTYDEILEWFQRLKDNNFEKIGTPNGLLDFYIRTYGWEKVNKSFQEHRQDYCNAYKNFTRELSST